MAGTDPLTLKTISLGADHSYACDDPPGPTLSDYVGSNDGTGSGTPTYQVDDQRGAPGPEQQIFGAPFHG